MLADYGIASQEHMRRRSGGIQDAPLASESDIWC